MKVELDFKDFTYPTPIICLYIGPPVSKRMSYISRKHQFYCKFALRVELPYSQFLLTDSVVLLYKFTNFFHLFLINQLLQL